jgi:hypothetical protein
MKNQNPFRYFNVTRDDSPGRDEFPDMAIGALR